MPARVRIHEDLLRVCTGAIGNKHWVARNTALVVDNFGLVWRPGKSNHIIVRLINEWTWRTAHERHQAKSGVGTAPQPNFRTVTRKADAACSDQRFPLIAL